jgi:predicted choloylglycine hydrolase
MRRLKLVLIGLVVVAALLSPVGLVVGEKAVEPSQNTVSKGIMTLELKGSPREMGMQYGSAARDAIRANLDMFWETVEDMGMSKKELLQKTSERSMPQDMIETLKAMSEAAGVSYLEVLAFNEFAPGLDRGACTCFVARGDATANGNPLSFKTSDCHYGQQVLLIVTPDIGYSYMVVAFAGGIGNSEEGMNEHGLSLGFNWLPISKNVYEDGLTTWELQIMILEQCATVDEAIALVESLPKQIGGNLMISGSEKAAFVEIAPSLYTPDCAYEIVESGFAVHTNHWMYEPFYSWVLDPSLEPSGDWEEMYIWTISVSRYDRAMELGTEHNGEMTSSLLMSFARDIENWGMCPVDIMERYPEWTDALMPGFPGNSICNVQTTSAAVFEVDLENPALLSTMWMAQNCPLFTPFLPLHTAILYDDATSSYARELLAPYISRDYYLLVGGMVAGWGDDLVPILEAWESSALDAIAEAILEVGDLVEAGQYADAAMLLTELDCDLAEEVWELQLGLQTG